MSLYEKLLRVQNKLSVPKKQKNDFGGYNFRSCEDIVEEAKPILEEEKLLLLLSDEIVQKGNRFYVKGVANLHDLENPKDKITVTAFAREQENKKGMDMAQITGAASSYARKYALNGLFAIDDNKDPDSTNKHGKNKKKKTSTKDTYINMIRKLYKANQQEVEPIITTFLEEINYDPGNLKNIKKLDENKSLTLLRRIQKKVDDK
jgi:hypothetical protein